tara:strand:- start:494 stop:727 length:234 start_codon:yes stop_codon:yes gene_type:complete
MVATIIISLLTILTVAVSTGATVAIIDSVRADREKKAIETNKERLPAPYRLANVESTVIYSADRFHDGMILTEAEYV